MWCSLNRSVCGIELEETNMDTEDGIDEAAHSPPVEKLIEDSGKMVFLVYLMDDLKKKQHRTLIFSQSRKMLDIIQKVLLSFVSMYSLCKLCLCLVFA